MARFGEYLYYGAGNDEAQIYRSRNGFNWRLVNTNPSFGSTQIMDSEKNTMVTNNIIIGELIVFKDKLYAFTWTKDINREDLIEKMIEDPDSDQKPLVSPSPGAFEVWRSDDGVNWEKVVGQNDPYGNGMGFCLLDPEGLNNDVAPTAVVFKGQLYLGTENTGCNTSIWRTSEGTYWEKVLDFSKNFGERFNVYTWQMISFEDKLFVGTLNQGIIGTPGVTGAQIWVSDAGDPGTFYNLVHNGFDGGDMVLC